MSDSILEKLTSLGLNLPAVPAPVAAYVNCVRTGNLLFLSGGLPIDGDRRIVGKVPSVVGVEDVSMVDLKRLGELVPQVNLEIVEPGPGTNAITMRVHERGAGITRACGTGACAAAVAGIQSHKRGW